MKKMLIDDGRQDMLQQGVGLMQVKSQGEEKPGLLEL